jgi:hypothetical protein
MKPKKYCPECGHEFKQGESDFNYGTVYTCPECEWEGTAPLDSDIIKYDLEDELGEGYTVTKDDIDDVVQTTAYCEDYDEAIETVANRMKKNSGPQEDEYEEGEDDMPEEAMVIEARRTDYSIDQVLSNRNCMTVGELKRMLEEYDDDDPTPIVFSHDNGYTYGPMQESGIEFREF